MGLSVTVLGCSGSYPGPGQACSGYLVRGGGMRIWLDAGSGTMANLQRHISLDDVDAVVLSHEHPDHWQDLEGFAVAATYWLGRTGIPIYAPRELSRLAYHVRHPTFEWCRVADGDDVTLDGMRIRFSRTDHGPETLAVRIDAEGRSLAYTADTGPEWHVRALGEGIDAVLCEATFLAPQEGETSHLSARQAMRMAREAGIERVLLTHLLPTNDRAATLAEAEAEWPGHAEVVEENQEYVL